MTNKTDTPFNFSGVTADDMNFKAFHGHCARADLEQWAELQNPKLATIQWHVVDAIGCRGFAGAKLIARQ